MKISGHITTYHRVVSDSLSETLNFLLLSQKFVELSKYAWTDLIGDPQWKACSQDPYAFVSGLLTRCKTAPSKPILLATEDVESFKIVITEAIPELDGARFEPMDGPGSSDNAVVYPSSSVSIYLDEQHFWDDSQHRSTEKANEFLAFLSSLFETIHGDFGYAHDTNDAIGLEGSAARSSFIPGVLAAKPRVRPGERTLWPLQAVYWANIFSSRWRRTIEQVLVKIASHKPEVRALPCGGLVVLAAPTPLNATAGENRQALWSIWRAAKLGPVPNRLLLWKLSRQFRRRG